MEGHADGAVALSPLQLGRASLTYALGGLAYKGVALLSVPILARLLTPAQLGVLDMAVVLASIVALAVAIGMDQGIPFLEPRTTPSDGLWAAALAIVAVDGLAALLIVVALQGPIASWAVGDPTRGSLVVAAALYGVVIALSGLTLVTIRLRASASVYALSSFFIVSAEMACALGAALLLEEPVVVMVLGWSAGATLVAVPLLLRYLPRGGARPRIGTIRRLATYGSPLIPATIAWVVGDASIRSTLARSGELDALGEYGIATRLAGVLALLVAGFGVAWYAYIFRSPAGAVAGRAGNALTVVVSALGGLAVAMTALSPEIVALAAGPPYGGATRAVAALSGGMVAMGAFVVISGAIGSLGSTRRVALAAVSGMAVQLVVAALVVERLGLSGAAIASLCGYVAAVSVVLPGHRSLLAEGRGLRVLAAVAATATLLVAAHLTLDLPLQLRLLIAAAGVAMVIVAATYSPVLRPGTGADG